MNNDNLALFLGTSALDDAANQSDELLQFSFRKALSKALNLKPVSFAVNTARKNRHLNKALNKTGVNSVYNRLSANFDSFDEDSNFDEFESFFKRKAGGTKTGNFLRKWVAPAVQGAVGGIPGVGGIVAGMLPIGQGLMMKPAEVKEAPVPAIMMSQTPAAAQNVVDTLAPNLSAAAKAEAVAAVRNSNSPEAAKTTLNELADADRKAKSRTTMYKIGGAITGVLVIILIIWLFVRKK